MSHLDELDEFEAELELSLKREYSAVFSLFRYCVLTQDATYLCNKLDVEALPQASYPFFHVRMEDVWVWDKNRPSRIIPRAEVYTSGDVTVEELRGEGEEPRLTAEALAERIGQPSWAKTTRRKATHVSQGRGNVSPYGGRAAAVVLRQPLCELSLGRVEVAAQVVLEPGNVVAKLNEPILEATLGIADVPVSLVCRERSAALVARHVVGVGEGAGHPVWEAVLRGRDSCPCESTPLERNLERPYRRTIYARAGSGTAPSWTSIPRVSQVVHASTTLPPSSFEIVSPVTVTSLPVGAMPAISPECAPRPVQRVATLSCSEIWSSTMTAPPGNAAMYLSKFARTPAGPRIGSASPEK